MTTLSWKNVVPSRRCAGYNVDASLGRPGDGAQQVVVKLRRGGDDPALDVEPPPAREVEGFPGSIRDAPSGLPHHNRPRCMVPDFLAVVRGGEPHVNASISAREHPVLGLAVHPERRAAHAQRLCDAGRCDLAPTYAGLIQEDSLRVDAGAAVAALARGEDEVTATRAALDASLGPRDAAKACRLAVARVFDDADAFLEKRPLPAADVINGVGDGDALRVAALRLLKPKPLELVRAANALLAGHGGQAFDGGAWACADAILEAVSDQALDDAHSLARHGDDGAAAWLDPRVKRVCELERRSQSRLKRAARLEKASLRSALVGGSVQSGGTVLTYRPSTSYLP